MTLALFPLLSSKMFQNSVCLITLKGDGIKDSWLWLGYIKDRWLDTNTPYYHLYDQGKIKLPNLMLYLSLPFLMFFIWFGVSFGVSSSPKLLNGQHLRVIWVVQKFNVVALANFD